MSPTLRVLIVEDNLDIAENISDFLEFKGHVVDFAYNGLMALSLVEEETFDVVIMDIMMPKMDGLSATEAIRGTSSGKVPIIMLTAKDTLDEMLDGFAAGADDYIIKPFAMPELYARILAQVRKSQQNYNHKQQLRGLELDQNEHTTKIDGVELALNPACFKILWQLAKAYPNLVAKGELEFALWGDVNPERDVLRSHVYNLRKALAKKSATIEIMAKHGQGYHLVFSQGQEQEICAI